jgi:nucleotide-binding universal stress UspA family protein
MKKYVVLIDFTPTAAIALQQAIASAKLQQAELILLHVLGHFQDNKKADTLAAMAEQLKQAEAAGITAKAEVVLGNLYDEVANFIRDHAIDLVFVGTHGMHGIKQTLFGSNIYKLVKGLSAPALVINDKSVVQPGGFKKVLLPVSPHEEFLVKVQQVSHLMAAGGEMVLFAVMKPGVNLDEPTSRNVQAAKQYLDEKGIPNRYEVVDANHFTLGYARETLRYVQDMDVDLIAIMTRVSVENQAFGKLDKEGMLLNELGLPIFCSNQV